MFWKCNRCKRENDTYRCGKCQTNTMAHNPAPSKYARYKLKRFGKRFTLSPS